MELNTEPVSGLPGRRAEVYAEFVGFDEHTRAGPTDSTRGRKSAAEAEAAGNPLGEVLVSSTSSKTILTCSVISTQPYFAIEYELNNYIVL